jgi:hypothetical protein
LVDVFNIHDYSSIMMMFAISSLLVMVLKIVFSFLGPEFFSKSDANANIYSNVPEFLGYIGYTLFVEYCRHNKIVSIQNPEQNKGKYRKLFFTIIFCCVDLSGALTFELFLVRKDFILTIYTFFNE